MREARTRLKWPRRPMIDPLFGDGGGDIPILTKVRATSAGFGQISEQSPATALQHTTRCVTADFLEDFEEFRLIYPLFRIRDTAFTASVSNGSGGAGNIMVVTQVSSGGVYIGGAVGNAGLAAGTYVLSQESGDKGGNGSYTISGSAVNIASGPFTGAMADEMFKNSGAIQTYETGVALYTPGYTGLPARELVTYDDGAANHVYNYALQDKSVGFFRSDWRKRPGGKRGRSRMEIWTRVTLPSSLAGMPVNKLANQFQYNRGWGVDSVTTGNSADPLTATTIPAVTSSQAGSSLCITPIAVEIKTVGGKSTIIAFGDSRITSVGLGIAPEPAGYGDSQGDIMGLGSATERGLYYVTRQHSVMIGKASDRGNYNARSSDNWHLRRGLGVALGDPDDKILSNLYGQNDQNSSQGGKTDYAAAMFCNVGMVINASNRLYGVVVGGVGGGTAPTGTNMNADIAFGANGVMIRYLGTTSVANEQQAYVIAWRVTLMNRALKAAAPASAILQELLGPYTSSTDQYATAGNQADGFASGVGKAYKILVDTNGAAWISADRTIYMTSMCGSRTVNGGPDDGTRTWKTSTLGTILCFSTTDGIHNNNPGAELGKLDWTRQAVLGVP